MSITKKLRFCLLLAAFFAFLPLANVSADSGRYFVKSTKGFWKNALGVRHEFDNGFSADVSDFQVRFAKVFGVEIEPISALQILPSDNSGQGDPISASLSETTDSSTPTLTPTPSKKPKVLKRGTAIRYLPSDQTPWGIQVIYDNPTIASTSGGLGVNVAVLDTGVDVLHPDLSGRIAQCKDFTNPRTSVLDKKCDDKNGHGTHVAGIIASDSGQDHLGLYGVAPSAKIFAYKVCDINGSCYADDIAFGLRTAADQGANVVNMSFGTNDDIQLVRDAINYAVSKGVLLVAAAGNDGPFTNSIDYPAAYASVVGVGAINQSLKVTDWSSRGINSQTTPYVVENGDIEFAAPGEYIESTWNNGGYAILSGTSMASPFVAGLAAKYWQSAASAPAESTRDFLHFLAHDIAPTGDDDMSGFGLPQVK